MLKFFQDNFEKSRFELLDENIMSRKLSKITRMFLIYRVEDTSFLFKYHFEYREFLFKI